MKTIKNETVINSKFTSHTVNMTDRNKANVTGISKVDSANAAEIVLTSCMGRLVITGSDLKITKFDETGGELSFTGNVDGIKYAQAKQSLIKRIFK